LHLLLNDLPEIDIHRRFGNGGQNPANIIRVFDFDASYEKVSRQVIHFSP
jgi:hypothetical protein